LTVAVDTNILCYALDPAYPEHQTAISLLTDLSQEHTIAINPTVIHETYHVLVFYLEWLPSEALKRLTMILKNPYVKFFSQTKKTSVIALNLAAKYEIGGRDALILACNVSNQISTFLTHEKRLLELQKVLWRDRQISIKDPI
jgi:predicted nucleic acid-binding protein